MECLLEDKSEKKGAEQPVNSRVEKIVPNAANIRSIRKIYRIFINPKQCFLFVHSITRFGLKDTIKQQERQGFVLVSTSVDCFEIKTGGGCGGVAKGKVFRDGMYLMIFMEDYRKGGC